MISFNAQLLKFDAKGEKTGWTYIPIPQKIAMHLKKDTRVSFRVKGSIDNMPVKAISLLPMGDGDFIMPVNAVMRKKLMKRKGDKVKLLLEADEEMLKISPALLACLDDEPAARSYFDKLPGSHQRYYSKWIETAKTDATKARRIALTVNACLRKMSFSQMMQEQKNKHPGQSSTSN